MKNVIYYYPLTNSNYDNYSFVINFKYIIILNYFYFATTIYGNIAVKYMFRHKQIIILGKYINTVTCTHNTFN